MQIHLSRLGFGLSSIAGSGDFSHQQRLIKTAIDCGVTHFDTAPYYGGGDSEKILGKILATCPEKVTIATKYGLAPIGRGKTGSLIRSTLRPIFRRIRYLKSVASNVGSWIYSPHQIQIGKSALLASLDESIKYLCRPVDIFLLHDASSSTAANPEVLEALTQARSSSMISVAGISGSPEDIQLAILKYPEVYAVAQLENSLPRPAPVSNLSTFGAKIITHRAIQGGLNDLLKMFETQPGFKQIWLRDIGIDPASSEALAGVLIELALSENPGGTVLFSTIHAGRIKKTAAILQTPVIGMDGCRQLRKLFNELQMNNDGLAAKA
jgi:D-threo-aldose 1-dehydrogenase